MKNHLTIAITFCFATAAALVMSACRNQPTAVNTSADVTGVYALASVDGMQLPASVSHQGATLQVRAGSFTLNADGTCRSRTVFVPPSGKEVTRDVSATYTRDGAKLIMRWKGAGKTVGTIEGDTFTMNNEGMMFIYRR